MVRKERSSGRERAYLEGSVDRHPIMLPILSARLPPSTSHGFMLISR